MHNILASIALLCCCLFYCSCGIAVRNVEQTQHAEILYQAGGASTSSTAFMMSDAYDFLQRNDLHWGKVARIERTRRNIIYVVSSTTDGSGNPNRLRWVSPGLVQMADARD